MSQLPIADPSKQIELARAASLGLASLLCFANFYAFPVIVSGNDLDLDPSQGGPGSAAFQLLYIGLFVVMVGMIFRAGCSAVLTRVPRFTLVTLTWCWLSLLWAGDPSTSFRRLALTTLVILLCSYLVELLSYDRIMHVLTITFGLIIVADWLAILLLPAATSAPFTSVASDGGWRGLHVDKNEAGAVCANCLIFFIHETIRSRSKLFGPLLCAATGLLLVQTHSKTSIGFVGLALLTGMVCSAVYANVAARIATLLTFAVVAIATIASADMVGMALQAVLDDPSAFTGRSEIWVMLIEYINDHLLLGAGYGSFWAIGENSPTLAYGSGWLTTVYAAHNGYLDLLVNIGLIGLILALCDAVIRPLVVVFTKPLATGTSRSFLCAMLIFAILHNLLESTFLNRASPAWVLVLVAFSILFKSAAAASTARPSASKVQAVDSYTFLFEEVADR